MSKELKTWRDVIQAMLDGEQVEFFSEVSGKWKDVLYFPTFHSTELRDTPVIEYRIKPRTILIGGMEVPEPVMDENALGEGEDYFLPNLHNEMLYSIYTWSEDNIDFRVLKRGLIHKTKEAAVIHAKALIKISGGNYDHS